MILAHNDVPKVAQHNVSMVAHTQHRSRCSTNLSFIKLEFCSKMLFHTYQSNDIVNAELNNVRKVFV